MVWVAGGVVGGLLIVGIGLFLLMDGKPEPAIETAAKTAGKAAAPPKAGSAKKSPPPPKEVSAEDILGIPPEPESGVSASSAPPALAPKGADGSPSGTSARSAVSPRATPSPEPRAVAVRSSTTEALKPLIEQLQDPNPGIRDEACLKIERLGSDATAAIPALRAALNDPDRRVRQSAYRALRIQHDVAVDVWIEAMRNPDPDIRLLVLEILPFHKERGVPPLVGAFRDKDERVRTKAAERLAALPWETPGLMASLQTALRDSDVPVRQAAAHAFAKMPPGHAKPAVPALAESLCDSDAVVRTRAGEALGRVPEASSLAVQALANSLDDKDPAIRLRAARALSMAGPRALDAAPRLTDLLTDEDVSVRDRASETLRGFRGVPVPLLIRALSGQDARARDWAVLELTNRPEESAVAVAAAIPEFTKREDRYRLVRVLNDQGGKAAPAVPALLAHLRGKDDAVRQAAADALVRLGPAAAPYVPDLIRLLRDPDPVVVQRAGMTLRNAGPEARAAIPELTKALQEGRIPEAVYEDILSVLDPPAPPK